MPSNLFLSLALLYFLSFLLAVSTYSSGMKRISKIRAILSESNVYCIIIQLTRNVQIQTELSRISKIRKEGFVYSVNHKFPIFQTKTQDFSSETEKPRSISQKSFQSLLMHVFDVSLNHLSLGPISFELIYVRRYFGK